MTQRSEVPLKVLYLAGAGRSGSTLVARLFGELDGYVHIGEASRYLFHQRMFSRIRVCGCGEDVDVCPFWRRHVATIDPALRRAATEAVRVRYLALPEPLRRRRLGAPRHDALCNEMASILRRVAQDAGARVLVDGSKNPANGFLLAAAPGIDLHVLHLVRHPGGVVASWSRPKGYLRHYSAPRVVSWWLAMNLFAERLGRRAVSYDRVRYEDAVADPAALLRRMTARLGVGEPTPEAPDLSFLTGDRARFGVQHALAGNPDKLQQGSTQISDRGWSLPTPRRLWVGAMSAPLRWRYGYDGHGVRGAQRVRPIS
jgi:hypothetical protein